MKKLIAASLVAAALMGASAAEATTIMYRGILTGVLPASAGSSTSAPSTPKALAVTYSGVPSAARIGDQVSIHVVGSGGSGKYDYVFDKTIPAADGLHIDMQYGVISGDLRIAGKHIYEVAVIDSTTGNVAIVTIQFAVSK